MWYNFYCLSRRCASWTCRNLHLFANLFQIGTHRTSCGYGVVTCRSYAAKCKGKRRLLNCIPRGMALLQTSYCRFLRGATNNAPLVDDLHHNVEGDRDPFSPIKKLVHNYRVTAAAAWAAAPRTLKTRAGNAGLSERGGGVLLGAIVCRCRLFERHLLRLLPDALQKEGRGPGFSEANRLTRRLTEMQSTRHGINGKGCRR